MGVMLTRPSRTLSCSSMPWVMGSVDDAGLDGVDADPVHAEFPCS